MEGDAGFETPAPKKHKQKGSKHSQQQSAGRAAAAAAATSPVNLADSGVDEVDGSSSGSDAVSPLKGACRHNSRVAIRTLQPAVNSVMCALVWRLNCLVCIAEPPGTPTAVQCY
jgi:hypothetical protein